MTELSAPTSVQDSRVDEAIADVEEQLSVLFGRVRALWKDGARQIHPELKPVGYKILTSIVRLGETTASALVDSLDTDKSVVSRQLRMLEDIGLVVARVDGKDGRLRLLTPTPEAIERVGAARSAYQEHLRALLRSRPESELTTFAGLLRLIALG